MKDHFPETYRDILITEIIDEWLGLPIEERLAGVKQLLGNNPDLQPELGRALEEELAMMPFLELSAGRGPDPSLLSRIRAARRPLLYIHPQTFDKLVIEPGAFLPDEVTVLKEHQEPLIRSLISIMGDAPVTHPSGSPQTRSAMASDLSEKDKGGLAAFFQAGESGQRFPLRLRNGYWASPDLAGLEFYCLDRDDTIPERLRGTLNLTWKNTPLEFEDQAMLSGRVNLFLKVC
ncbi:MAG: hypothetical protein KDI06_03435 [Calditrichaeota bacterium]|nr:hypothetical protein [Calditrichota bacterium]